MTNIATTRLLTGARAIHPDFTPVRKANKTKKVQILLQLARQDGGDDWITQTVNTINAAKVQGQIICVTDAEWQAHAGANPNAVVGVHKFANRRPYKVISVDAGMCEAVIEGTVADIKKDFGSDVLIVRETKNRKNKQIQRVGPAPTLPPELDGLVKGVHMSTVPVARTGHRFLNKPQKPHAPKAGEFQGFTVLDAAIMYLGVGGNSPRFKTAVGELGGGVLQKDFATYCKSIGVTASKLNFYGVDGGKNQPMGLQDAGGECYLDLCCLAGLLNLWFGFGPNTSAAIAHLISQARKLGCHGFSLSWGMYAPGWSAADRSLVGNAIAYFVCTGGVVAVAQGDTGPVDGNPSGADSTDFPGEDDLAWSGGGTLRTGGTGPDGKDEYWNEDPTQSAGGYGESQDYPQPAWQALLYPGKKGRWCPDGSITADPASGFRVYGGGQWAVIGGTSDIPDWMREVALVSEKIGQPLGLPHAFLYTHNAKYKLFTPVLDATGKIDPRCGLGTPNFANWVTCWNDLQKTAKNLPVPEGFVLASF